MGVLIGGCFAKFAKLMRTGQNTTTENGTQAIDTTFIANYVISTLHSMTMQAGVTCM